jgi:hypothetical protein
LLLLLLSSGAIISSNSHSCCCCCCITGTASCSCGPARAGYVWHAAGRAFTIPLLLQLLQSQTLLLLLHCFDVYCIL